MADDSSASQASGSHAAALSFALAVLAANLLRQLRERPAAKNVPDLPASRWAELERQYQEIAAEQPASSVPSNH